MINEILQTMALESAKKKIIVKEKNVYFIAL